MTLTEVRLGVLDGAVRPVLVPKQQETGPVSGAEAPLSVRVKVGRYVTSSASRAATGLRPRTGRPPRGGWRSAPGS